MGSARIFVTWPIEPEARAILERAGTVETSPTEDELPQAELARVHPGLLDLDQVVLTPHIGSASRAARLAMATRAAENCAAALGGQRPPSLVNPEAWRGP